MAQLTTAEWWQAGIFGALLCLCTLTGSSAADSAIPGSLQPAKYIGRAGCVECHEAQNTLWRGSAHDLAMDEATKETVRGDFRNASFSYFGVTTKFYIRDGKYYVSTDGPDGKQTEYRVQYVFGYYPLQQYLLDFGAGFYQALNVCWDTRPKEAGGQRWFHLYPHEEIRSNDPLHWTKRLQTWNYACAECHSTNLEKNFDEKAGTYKTRWSEIDVSCEGCHGPSSEHVTWARKFKAEEDVSAWTTKGLEARLARSLDRVWAFGDGPTAKLASPEQAKLEQVETCARCHSRRVQLTGEYHFGRPLLDTHRLDLLTEHLYYPDGQAQDEVYIHGSFLQSKMYAAGVVCSDCHDSHSTKLIAPGNAVCARCHLPTKYDVPEHHFHKPGSAGASCVECHAPQTKFMVIDERADHTFRIPRPDLTEQLGTIDACSHCHTDKPPSWSREAFRRWYKGYEEGAKPHYGKIIADARLGKPGSGERLRELALDAEKPAIVRATALSMLGAYPRDRFVQTLEQGAASNEALIRYGAARALEQLSAEGRLRVALPLLSDPLRAIRLEAAASLAPLLGETEALKGLSPDQRKVFDERLAEYERSLIFNSDTAAALLSRALLASYHGELKTAEGLLKRGIELEPYSQTSYINLADLYRTSGRDKEGERYLRQAVTGIADSAETRFALGLLLVRQGQSAEALKLLKEAAEMRPQFAHFTYVYAVGLDSSGNTAQALDVIQGALKRHPFDPELLSLKAGLSAKTGAVDEGREALRTLILLDPDNPE